MSYRYEMVLEVLEVLKNSYLENPNTLCDQIYVPKEELETIFNNWHFEIEDILEDLKNNDFISNYCAPWNGITVFPTNLMLEYFNGKVKMSEAQNEQEQEQIITNNYINGNNNNVQIGNDNVQIINKYMQCLDNISKVLNDDSVKNNNQLFEILTDIKDSIEDKNEKGIKKFITRLKNFIEVSSNIATITPFAIDIINNIINVI